MTSGDFFEDFFAFSQISPDIRPIHLPMTDLDKSQVNSIFGSALPNSNVFDQYAQHSNSTHELANANIVLSHGQVTDYHDDDYYPAGFGEQHGLMPMQHINNDAMLTARVTQQARKRKASTPPDYIAPCPQKRVAVTQFKLEDVNGDYHDLSGQPSPYSSIVPTPGFKMAYPSTAEYDSPRIKTHQYSTSNASQVSLTAPSPHTPAFSPSCTAAYTEHSPGGPITPAPRPESTSYTGGNPQLVRTSTMPQQGSPSLNPSSSASMYTYSFNPYTMYPNCKANLVLHGDLDGVGLDWTADQQQAARKLIVFTRNQSGSTINAEFKTIAPSEWRSGDITVNCIWWQERGEAFVTSVDTIALLQSLISVNFTVEEKNRIRRNLEGFRPLTVSKAKADSEEFFKVIMGFPEPKPRNIEKDVKVFPWKILAHALKKIVGKYSASYASTKSMINAPAPSGYANTEYPGDYHLAPSPHQEMVSGGLPAGPLPATSYDSAVPLVALSAPLVNGVPDLSLQVPGVPASYEAMSQTYPYQQMPIVPHTMAPHTMAPFPASAPVDRMQNGWACSPYEGQQQESMSAPPTGYFPMHADAGEMMGPAYYMHHR